MTRYWWAAAAVFLVLVPGRGQERVNQGAAVLKDFDARGRILKLRKTRWPGPWTETDAIGGRTRSASVNWPNESAKPAGRKAGGHLRAAIAAQFRRLMSLAMKGGKAARVRQSLDNAEPVRIPLHVNGEYPASVPRQSTPPTLLLNLPRLPAEVAYGVVGHDLLLRDIGANLIVDFIPGAIP